MPERIQNCSSAYSERRRGEARSFGIGGGFFDDERISGSDGFDFDVGESTGIDVPDVADLGVAGHPSIWTLMRSFPLNSIRSVDGAVLVAIAGSAVSFEHIVLSTQGFTICLFHLRSSRCVTAIR